MTSKTDFWNGFGIGALVTTVLLAGLGMIAFGRIKAATGSVLAINEKSNASMIASLSGCTEQLTQSTARIKELRTPIVLWEDKAPAEMPAYSFHGLVEIRPGQAFAQADVRPRWIVQPGEIPADVWRSPNSGYGLWDAQQQKITGPFGVE